MAVGRMGKGKGFDFAQVMISLSPVAHKVFWEMVKVRDEATNIVEIESKNQTQSQNSIISKGYRLLTEVDLVLKTGKGTYMINPHAVLPLLDKCQEVNLEWEKQYGRSKVKER